MRPRFGWVLLLFCSMLADAAFGQDPMWWVRNKPEGVEIIVSAAGLGDNEAILGAQCEIEFLDDGGEVVERSAVTFGHIDSPNVESKIVRLVANAARARGREMAYEVGAYLAGILEGSWQRERTGVVVVQPEPGR